MIIVPSYPKEMLLCLVQLAKTTPHQKRLEQSDDHVDKQLSDQHVALLSVLARKTLISTEVKFPPQTYCGRRHLFQPNGHVCHVLVWQGRKERPIVVAPMECFHKALLRSRTQNISTVLVPCVNGGCSHLGSKGCRLDLVAGRSGDDL